MDAPEVPAQQAQEIVSAMLLNVPAEMLDEITQYVPNLSALLQASRQLSADASVEWANYLEYVAHQIDLSKLPGFPDDQIFVGGLGDEGPITDAMSAWIVTADEFTTQMANVDYSSLGGYVGDVHELATSIQATIKSGLDNEVGKFMMASEHNDDIDQATRNAYARIVAAY